MMCLKTAAWVSNSVDPDQTPRSVASDLGIQCLHTPVCPKTWSKCDIQTSTDIERSVITDAFWVVNIVRNKRMFMADYVSIVYCQYLETDK